MFLFVREAHHSLELWTSLSLDKTLSFGNLSLPVIFPGYKAYWLYTFVCTASQESSAATALWSIFEGCQQKGWVWSGLTLVLHLCHPTARKENNDTTSNEIAPDLQLWSNCKPVLLLAAKFQVSFTNTWESIREIFACFMSSHIRQESFIYEKVNEVSDNLLWQTLKLYVVSQC